MKLKDKINQARMLMDTAMIQAHRKVAPEYVGKEEHITPEIKKQMYNNVRKWSIILILIIVIVIIGVVGLL